MVLHPECQKRAQQEIDSVVGPGRLPEFSDRESLPYVDCILQETLRFVSEHAYVVAIQSFCLLQMEPSSAIRGMALDEKVYTDAQAFNPSRYLPLPEGNHEPYPHPFGFGRRICPGRHLADASVWIAMASILATFDILKPIGSDGKEITPEVKFSTGITSQPSTFYCHIRPRNDQARDLIMHADTSDNY
ncbi:hypothetical protein C0989_002091 [Termitomyces sp. Mn162]|nr:hypothetical protein C0989_002091 [Termitomyces sp. Mn162]